MRRFVLPASAAVLGAGGLLLATLAAPLAQPGQTVAIDQDDIGGVVSGPNGPEAGVWVIAETRDLGVRYIKSVVTDDQGRYVVPDLPAAKYQVWARGYGLVDSAKATASPGQQLNIKAVPAPNDAEAARYYPAIYWYAMLKKSAIEMAKPGAKRWVGKSPLKMAQLPKECGTVLTAGGFEPPIPADDGTVADKSPAMLAAIAAKDAGPPIPVLTEAQLKELTGGGSSSVDGVPLPDRNPIR